jgi:hypothetical protein
MFCAPKFIFSGTEGTGSRFNVLRSRTHFHRYRGPRVPYSCFSLPDSFSKVPRATGPVFMFCDPRLFFGGTEIVGSRFHVWRRVQISCSRSRTHFQWYRGRRVPFSNFALLDSFSKVPRALSSVLMFCALGLIFGGSEGVGCSFHDLCSRTRFRRYRGR